MDKKLALPSWILILLILALSILVQSQILLKDDVSWHLEVTRRFLEGGNYSDNFLDINPPILIYIYIPCVLLAKFLSLSIVNALRLYVFILGLISLCTCYVIIQKELLKSCSFVYQGLLIAIAFIFFLMPAYEFGQREHLLLLFLFPYFLLMAALVNQRQFSKKLRIWVAMLAGVGLCINIIFITIFIILEIFLAIKNKSWRSLLRLENLIIAMIIGLYTLSIYLLAPEYFSLMLPLIAFLYIPAFNISWITMLFSTTFASWLGCLILLPLQWKNSEHKNLLQTFFITSSVCVIIFIMTRKLWYYHMLPTLSTTLILYTIFLCENLHIPLTHQRVSWFFWIKFFAVYVLLIIFPIATTYNYILYNIATSRSKNLGINQLIQYTKNQTNNSPVFVFSMFVATSSTLIDYADIQLGSRLPSMWMLPQLTYLENQDLSPENKVKLNNVRKLLFNSVVEDFQKYKPRWVIIDKSELLPSFGPWGEHFNYLEYFKQDERFKKIWKKYCLKKTIANFEIYTTECQI